MEWFGLTIYGCPDAIKDMMRRDYEEPKVQPDLMEVIAKGSEKPFAELVAELDCYLGQCDGYAYKSYDRLLQMRRKGIFKPVGPSGMYRYPGTESMKTSFWRADPALKDATWYKPCLFAPIPYTEICRYMDNAKKIDKFFKL